MHITKFKKKEFVLNTNLTVEEEKLKLAGTMLYWGEGTKGGSSVAFTNSNPEMIAIFVRFLREICGIDTKRLRLGLHLYPDHNEGELKKYWAKIARVPLSQMNKAYIHVGTKGSYKMKSKYGTVAVVYSDVKLLELVNSWIAEYSSILSRPA